VDFRKDNNLRCGNENSFLLKDIYEELFKRFINPIYIIIVSLISTLIIMKNKIEQLQNYYKFILFITGFTLIIFSELTYKFIFESIYLEILTIILPLIFVLIFYLFILIKSNFKLSHL
jgi:ABC-type protease/lipase transport system fused ATPase/permease subunit